jgi:hypothetical protein
MASGFRPNDQMSLPGLGLPIDPLTGELITQVTRARLERLKTAEDVFRQILHELDGSTMGSQPGDRRMIRAFTRLDEALMWAQAAILNHYGR